MATLATSTRFFHAGLTKVYFLPVVASALLVPTRAEITSGTDLSAEIADLAGWTVSSGEIDCPDLGTTFTGKIPGRTSTDDCSLTFYQDKTGADVRTLLPRDTAGFIMFADGGDVTGNKADVFPIRVRSNGKLRSVGDESARLMIPFSITRKPAESIALPATV